MPKVLLPGVRHRTSRSHALHPMFEALDWRAGKNVPDLGTRPPDADPGYFWIPAVMVCILPGGFDAVVHTPQLS